MDTRQPDQIAPLLHEAIDKLESPGLRSQVQHGFIRPERQRRMYPTEAGTAQGDLWIFYVVPGRNVALAYSDEGYASYGMRWGLVFVDSDEYGTSGGWYNSLRDLLVDSGYFKAD